MKQTGVLLLFCLVFRLRLNLAESYGQERCSKFPVNGLRFLLKTQRRYPEPVGSGNVCVFVSYPGPSLGVRTRVAPAACTRSLLSQFLLSEIYRHYGATSIGPQWQLNYKCKLVTTEAQNILMLLKDNHISRSMLVSTMNLGCHVMTIKTGQKTQQGG